MNVWSIHNKGNLYKIWQQIERENYDVKEGTLVLGDFNIKIGEPDECMNHNNIRKLTGRKSKDKTTGKDGSNLLDKLENKGWIILNGATVGDEDNEFTLISSRGNSVIDYDITNEDAWNKIGLFKVEKRIESNHLLI